jgi:hypothetical protein
MIVWRAISCFLERACERTDGAAWTTTGQMKNATTDEPNRFLGCEIVELLQARYVVSADRR